MNPFIQNILHISHYSNTQHAALYGNIYDWNNLLPESQFHQNQSAVFLWNILKGIKMYTGTDRYVTEHYASKYYIENTSQKEQKLTHTYLWL